MRYQKHKASNCLNHNAYDIHALALLTLQVRKSYWKILSDIFRSVITIQPLFVEVNWQIFGVHFVKLLSIELFQYYVGG